MLMESARGIGDYDDTPEPQVFRKCQDCKSRPASIRCNDCKTEDGVELFCYGCSRKAHSEKSYHNYEYATFKEMLLNDEFCQLDEEQQGNNSSYFNSRSYNARAKILSESHESLEEETAQHPLRGNNYLGLRNSSNVFQPRTNLAINDKHSPGRKDYQTFGKSGERDKEREKDKGAQTGDSWSGGYFMSNKENYQDTGNFGLVLKTSKENDLSAYKKYTHPKINSSLHSESVDTVKLIPGSGEANNLRQSGVGRRDREILRPIDVSPVDPNKRQTAGLRRNLDSRRNNNLSAINNSPENNKSLARKESKNLVEEEKSSATTPTRSLAQDLRNTSKGRELSYSRTKGMEGLGNSILHSPIYIESITELHKTEIEGLKTRHRLELEKIENQLNEQNKVYHLEVRELTKELERYQEEACDADNRAQELDRVVKNLKLQNNLLKEENELLRQSTQDNSSREADLCREVDRLQKLLEDESVRNKSRSMEEVHKEYEEHFSEQMAIFNDSIRNKDSILRCKDEMIANLEQELERLRRHLDSKH